MDKFWAVKNEGQEAELLIYGQIANESWSGDEVTASEFANEIKGLGGKDLKVRINSMGGDVFAAQAIYSCLKGYRGKVTVYIDGICASAATIVACGGYVKMARNALYMIHNPMSELDGYYDEEKLKKVSTALNTIKRTILNVYLEKVAGKGISQARLMKMLDAETYMTAEEALNYGFIDEICEKNAKIENKNGEMYVNSLAINPKMVRKPEELIKRIKTMGNEKMENQIDFKAMSDEELGKIARNMLNSEAKSVELLTAAENKETDVKMAVLEERERITALDNLLTGNNIIDAYIKVAKQGDTTVEEATAYVNEMKKAISPVEQIKDSSTNFVEAMKLVYDQMTSGGAGVKGSTPSADREAEKEAAINEMVKYANEIRGVK